MKIKKTMMNLYHKIQIKHQMQQYDNNLNGCLAKNHVEPISNEKFVDVVSFWNQYLNNPVGKQYYSLLLYINPGIGDEHPIHEYVSESIMFPNIIRQLNPVEAWKSLSDKGMYGVIFHDVNRPYEYVRVCNNIWLDNENQIITKEIAINRILEKACPIVIKQNRDSYGGHGVKVLKEYDKVLLESLMDSYKNNFVVQKLVKQSSIMSELNPTSLNTCRVITLFLNNRVSVIAHNVRVGGKDKEVDNVASGGMNVGITTNGTLTEGVQDEVFHIKKTPNGTLLQGYQITQFKKVCDFACQLHSRIPLCALAGWDIALDDEDNPILIEVNLNCPDVKNMQMINGPIFKERFNEVVEFVFKR